MKKNNTGNKNQQAAVSKVRQENRYEKNTTLKFQVLFLFLFAAGLYANTLLLHYALDDKLMLTDNAFTKKGISGIKDILINDSFVGYFGEKTDYVAGGRYRPLSQVMFAVEYEYFGLNPFTGHLVNVLMYALACVVLFLTMRKMFRQYDKDTWFLSVSFLATALFIAHPLHTEAVANIKGRDEIMSLLGSMAALFFTFKYIETKKIVNVFLSSVIFFLALLSKENAITFLAVIPLSLFVFTKAVKKDYIATLLPLLVVSSVYIFIRYRIMGYLIGGSVPADILNNPFVNASAGDKYATILYTWGKYLYLLFIPHPLTNDYFPKHIPIISWSDIKAIFSLLIYLVLAGYACVRILKKDVIAYGILFFLLTFSIQSNLVFPIGTFMNERFMFISLLGFCIIISYLLIFKLKKYITGRNTHKYIVAIIAVAVLLGYSVKTISRNPAWDNDYTLFSTDINVSPNSIKCNVSLGEWLLKKGRDEKDVIQKKEFLEQSIKYFSKGLELYPQYIIAWIFLGDAYTELKDYQKAESSYRECFRVDTNSAQAYSKLGELYGKCLNKIDKSEEYLLKAFQINPKDASTMENLGIVYGIKGDFTNSLLYFEKALKLKPDDPQLLRNISQTYKSMGNVSMASEYLNKANRLNGTDK